MSVKRGHFVVIPHNFVHWPLSPASDNAIYEESHCSGRYRGRDKKHSWQNEDLYWFFSVKKQTFNVETTRTQIQSSVRPVLTWWGYLNQRINFTDRCLNWSFSWFTEPPRPVKRVTKLFLNLVSVNSTVESNESPIYGAGYFKTSIDWTS